MFLELREKMIQEMYKTSKDSDQLAQYVKYLTADIAVVGSSHLLNSYIICYSLALNLYHVIL